MAEQKVDTSNFTFAKYPFLKELGFELQNFAVFNGEFTGHGGNHIVTNPSTQEPICAVRLGTPEDFESCIAAMDKVHNQWAEVPAPKRGQVLQRLSEVLRKKKQALGQLIALEMGKIAVEGQGEVQEAIDICDMGVGLARTMCGSVIPSERPGHFMMERYLPMKKHVAIITAFNFPVAVFFWNAALSLICGNTQIHKGATSTSLCSITCTRLLAEALVAEGYPACIGTSCQGAGSTIGDKFVKCEKIGLISFTGSTQVGRRMAGICAERFCKTIMELGGNNAVIVHDDADINLALRGCVFAAVGTAGQRCTSLRRVVVHEKIYDKFTSSLATAYKSIRIGDPLDAASLCGPLHTKTAVKEHMEGIALALKQGGKILAGGGRPQLAGNLAQGNFVEPTIIEIPHDAPCVMDELFTPVLYVIKYSTLDEAIAINNEVPQGLSSSLFTRNLQNSFKWCGPLGSDCGIVNVNIGPSGAEIGGAFGGEKETGFGRESGSDSWKQYCQRVTCTINHSNSLPLAQGIKFDIAN